MHNISCFGTPALFSMKTSLWSHIIINDIFFADSSTVELHTWLHTIYLTALVPEIKAIYEFILPQGNLSCSDWLMAIG